MTANRFCEITPELQHLSKLSEQCARIDPALYTKYDVKRGLRDINGKGVLVGLTEISDVCSTKMREFDTLKCKNVPQSLEIDLFFCQIFIFII